MFSNSIFFFLNNSQAPDEVTKYLLEKLTNKNSTASEIIHLVGKEITRFHAIY